MTSMRNSAVGGYPTSRRTDQVDDFFGVKVADPYRWLENSDSKDTAERDEVSKWVEAQNKRTFGYLNDIKARKPIRERLAELMNFKRYGAPVTRGDRSFFTFNSGLMNQAVVFVIDTPGAEPRALLDPNTLSEDGTVALSGWSLSNDGTLMAYSLSKSGSDWQEWHVLDVASGKDLPDVVQWSKFSGASWLKDNSGFYYSRFDAPSSEGKLANVNKFQKLCFHKLGTPQSQDVVVYERKDQPEWGFMGYATADGNYLIISIWAGSSGKNRVFYQDLNTKGPVVELLSANDASYSLIDNDGTTFWFATDLNAPRNRVIAIDISKSTAGAPAITEVVAEAAETLGSVGVVHDRFFLQYLKDAHTVVREVGFDGKHIRDTKLPGIGSAGGFGGGRSQTETCYTFTSFTLPPTVYRYDIVSGTSTEHFSQKFSFDPSKYVTKQIFYKSKDGTKIPLFISYKKGLKRNSKNATKLYGYGGFNVPLTPTFSTANLQWMEMGGVSAIACLRGGGEYGTKWHESGTKLQKQNVFDDFIAAAQWLIRNKYTSRKKLAINGGSNGGLLVGACMTQRPDLFAAALPEVGVLDMLRFHKFTIGRAWVSDYGSVEKEDEFKALLAYSPLHNLKEGVRYPATMVVTGDHDDRVVPAHSYKFAAALQHAQGGKAPTLIRVETNAGHGAGKPTAKVIAEAADKAAFLVKALEIPARKWRRKK